MKSWNEPVGRDSLGGWPLPRFYQVQFELRPDYLAIHWHWFWLSADRLQVIAPPAPPAETNARVALTVITALAQALVAELLCETITEEGSKE